MTDEDTLGRVARLYYEHGLTHAEIADLVSMSRIKVTRLLAEARRAGIVEITVHSDVPAFAELEQSLATQLELKRVWIAPSVRAREGSATSLGKVGAHALMEVLPSASRAVVGLSASVQASLQHVGRLDLPELEVYPVGGGRFGRASGADPTELVSTLARKIGGTPFGLPAPLIASTHETAEELLSSPGVKATLAAAETADLMIVGIGGIERVPTTLAEWAPEGYLEKARALGAVGDISARFFDAQGSPVAHELDAHVVGLTLKQMRAINTRLAIAGGRDRIFAIQAAARAKLINALVTDVGVAHALLRLE